MAKRLDMFTLASQAAIGNLIEKTRNETGLRFTNAAVIPKIGIVEMELTMGSLGENSDRLITSALGVFDPIYGDSWGMLHMNISQQDGKPVLRRNLTVKKGTPLSVSKLLAMSAPPIVRTLCDRFSIEGPVIRYRRQKQHSRA